MPPLMRSGIERAIKEIRNGRAQEEVEILIDLEQVGGLPSVQRVK